MLLLAYQDIRQFSLLTKVPLEEFVMLVRSFVIVVIEMGQETVILQVANLERSKYKEQQTVVNVSMDVSSVVQLIPIFVLIVDLDDILMLIQNVRDAPQAVRPVQMLQLARVVK